MTNTHTITLTEMQVCALIHALQHVEAGPHVAQTGDRTITYGWGTKIHRAQLTDLRELLEAIGDTESA